MGGQRRRSGHTTAVTIGAERLYLTANQRDDGSLGEIFIHWGKHGTSSAGLVSSYALALSAGLAHRVPLADLLRPALGQHFMPNGRTDDPEIPAVCSAVDYIARRLALDWLPEQQPLSAAWRRWPADPGGEQVAEADHAADRASLHDREVPEAVQEHHLGRVLDRGVRFGGLGILGHPRRDLDRGEVGPGRRGPQDVAFGEDAGQEAALHDQG